MSRTNLFSFLKQDYFFFFIGMVNLQIKIINKLDVSKKI